MLIKKEKIEDLEFMDVELDDDELRAIVMEDEDNAKKKAEEEYNENVKRVERLKLKEAMKGREMSGSFALFEKTITNRLTDKRPYVVIGKQ